MSESDSYSIRIQYYSEAITLSVSDFNSSYEDSTKVILEKFPIIKNPDKIKFFFISPETLQRVELNDDNSLKKFLSLEDKLLLIIDEELEKSIMDTSPPEVSHFCETIENIEKKSKTDITVVNNFYKSQIQELSTNLEILLKNAFKQDVIEKVSNLITIQINSNSEEENIHSHTKVCSICRTQPLKGNIFQCEICSYYTLCQQCYSRFKSEYFGHQKEHRFYKIFYDHALYRAGKQEMKESPTEWIQSQQKRLLFFDDSYKVEMKSPFVLTWNFIEKEKMLQQKIPYKFENIGSKNISNFILTSPFGNEKYNIFKIDFDISLNNNKEDELMWTPPKSLKEKLVGNYYVPIAIGKSKKYIKSSFIIFEIRIMIEVPDYKLVE